MIFQFFKKPQIVDRHHGGHILAVFFYENPFVAVGGLIDRFREILARRLAHSEWPLPSAIVVDGGKPQKKVAETVLAEEGLPIPVVAVVKDERHRPREVIGAHRASVSEADAVLANAEAHRFSLSKHRRARSKLMRT